MIEGRDGTRRPALFFMHLSLRRRDLSAWPAAHPDSAAVTTLDLGFNRLEYLPASPPAAWPRLDRLWLHHNRLHALPADLSAYAGLRELDLSYNQLESLPDSIGDLASLEILHLQGNRLRALPAAFARL